MLLGAFDIVIAPAIAYITSLVVVSRYMAHLIGGVIRYSGRQYARGGVFVVRFVVNDDKDDTDSIIVTPVAASSSFALLSMTTKTIRIQSCWQPTWSYVA